MRGTIKFRLKPGECRTVAGIRFCNRWQKNTSRATEDYKRGIQNPRRPWGRCTCEAADRYKTGIDRAHSRGAYARGVKRVGFVRWKSRTLRKGPTRFSEGVAGAGDDYARGYKPYHDLIPSIFLPKRFPRGDPRNIDRVKTVCSEFGRLRTGLVTARKTVCPED